MTRINVVGLLVLACVGCAAPEALEEDTPRVAPTSELSIETVYSTACLAAPIDRLVTMPVHPPYTNGGEWSSPNNWPGYPGCEAWTVEVTVPGRGPGYDHTPEWVIDIQHLTPPGVPLHEGFDLSDVPLALSEKECLATQYFFSLFRRHYNEVEYTITGQGSYNGKMRNGLCKLVPVGTPLVPPLHISYPPAGKSDHYRVALALTTSSQRQNLAFQLFY